MKAGNIEQFQHLSNFRDLKDFNNHIEQWMIDLKQKFTKSELIALKRLIRFSAKVAGISNAKIQTLVSACHEAGQEISRSTYERMLRKAKKFGLLIVYNTTKENGKQSHNVYVFQRYQSQIVSDSSTIDVAESAKIDGAYKTNNLLETNNQNNINKRNENVQKDDKLDASFTSNRVPTEFRDLVKCFFDDYKTIEEFWKVITIQTYYYTYMSIDDKVSLAIDAMKQLIRNIKFGRKVRNIFGLYYAIVGALLDREYESTLIEMYEEYAS
ncbi:hypothetical protein NP92_04225 [Anoxybacillus gonensis]|uniref:Uncharacterized protein n=1 Tax=Anoxybacillus gonensis TaxID=198467 RepID=A0AAW7TEP0_9BACL|nr:hypothetical protein [Anoxybacillus gonensis]AKS37681.1 hypothetical protein AFK25_03795 [Anoxybacillus gonensis]KGP61603.1 hypothetical protein NP92_04225 [Anoxybacillus gonensis]MDO0876501.1 hypothetical protein [Anoxybacillus gonensis]